MDALIQENKMLMEEIEVLKDENNHLKIQLEKYTHSQKEYYEKNKKIIKEKALQRLTSLDKEKLKEYRRTAYLNQKEKKIKELKNETI